MKRLKTVGIKELKNNLSAYLREVRGGATVLVSDRDNIVAEVREPYGPRILGEELNPLLLEWAQAGVAWLPTTGKAPLPVSPVTLRAGTSAKLLKSDREEKHE